MLRRIPEDNHWWFASRTRAIEALLAGRAPRGAPLRVLDVGCGAGNMMHHLAQFGTVTGMDSFEKPLRVCRERGYQAELGDAQNMPFDNACFDLVAAFDVIEHCPDDARAVAECARVCKPGGHLVFTVPAYQWLWSENDTLNRHYRRYSAGAFRRLLTGAGLQPLRVTYNNFIVFPLAAGVIVLRKALHKELAIAAPTTDEEAYQVEMQPSSPPVNAVLTAVGQVEAGIIRRVSLPWGTGLLALAHKPGARG